VRRLGRPLITAEWLLPRTARGDDSQLSPAELETLVSFGESIVEGRALSTEAHVTLTEVIADAVDRAPDRVGLYRSAARLLDRLAGGRLAGLSLADRATLITRHRLDIRVVEDEAALPDDARFVRASLAPELIVGYWRSAAGWTSIGYHTFPGRCGDLARYTRPEP